jgi:tripartite-type tricarboxylate transporter receptor subunit TctC
VTGRTRLPSLPDVPTVHEQGAPRLDVSNWFALLGPAGLPDAITDRLAQALNDALRQHEVQDGFAQIGAEQVYASPQDTMAFVEKDHGLWIGVAKALAQRGGVAAPK